MTGKAARRAITVAVLVIAMCFFAVPVVLAGTGSGYNGPGYEPGPPDHPDPILTVVEGEVTWVSTVDDVIEVTDGEGSVTTVNGLPLWLNIGVGDQVLINCRISPDGKYVACSLTINEGDLIILR